MNINNATPAKLRTGEWGARVVGDVAVGDTVTITTRAGKSWSARVTRVVWSGEGVTLVETASLDGGPRRAESAHTAPRRGGCGCDCGECSPCCRCEPHCNCRGGNIYDC